MEKCLVIILLILLLYTVYQCWILATVTTEGFADATPTPKPAEVPTNVDTNNSIKTLAQLATDLQSGGGLKVPGVQSLANGVWHNSLDGKNRIHYGANATTYFGSQDGYIWRNKGDGDIMRLGDNGVQSLLNDVWHTSLDGKKRVHYASNSRTYFGSQSGYEWRNKADQAVMAIDDNGDLTAYGKLNVGGMDIVAAIKDLQNSTIRHNDKINIIVGEGNTGTGGSTYMGICGSSGCGGMESVVMTNEPGRGKFKITKI